MPKTAFPNMARPCRAVAGPALDRFGLGPAQVAAHVLAQLSDPGGSGGGQDQRAGDGGEQHGHGE
jgi:hypothetical protein